MQKVSRWVLLLVQYGAESCRLTKDHPLNPRQHYLLHVLNVDFRLVWFSFKPHQSPRVINAKSIFIHINSSISNNPVLYKYSFCLNTVKCQNSSISNNLIWYKYSFNVKSSSILNNLVQHTETVPFQTIQFSITTQFSSTNPGQCAPGSDGIKRVLRIPQSSSITGTSLSDCQCHIHNIRWLCGLIPMQRGSRSILQLQPTGQIGFPVEPEDMFGDLWRHVTIACDHANHNDVDWGFGFHHSRYIL